MCLKLYSWYQMKAINEQKALRWLRGVLITKVIIYVFGFEIIEMYKS